MDTAIFRGNDYGDRYFSPVATEPKNKVINKEEAARYYLPPQSGQVALPTLKNEKNRPS